MFSLAVEANEHRAAASAPRLVGGCRPVGVYVCLTEFCGRDEYPHAALAASPDALPCPSFIVTHTITESVHGGSLTNNRRGDKC